MKDINDLYERCVDKLNSIDIFPNYIDELMVNSRAKTIHGQYSKRFDTRRIEISNRLLADDVPDFPAENTMIHELLHAVDGCEGHKGKWKRLAEKVNKTLGYKIQRCSDYSEYIDGEHSDGGYNYEFKCKRCGQIIRRRRNSKFVRMYKRYRCGVCGGEFEKKNL